MEMNNQNQNESNQNENDFHVSSPFYYKDSRNKNAGNKYGSYIATGLISSVIGGLIVAFVMLTAKPIINPVVDKTLSTLFPAAASKLTSSEGNNQAVILKNIETDKYTSPVVAIAQKAGPSIVGIKVKITYKYSSPLYEMFGDSTGQIEREAEGEGSGIIVKKNGYILTNYHVIESAYGDNKNQTGKIEVYLPNNNKPIPAKIIGTDSKTDLAIIKIEQDNLPEAELGDSSKIQVGELAVAIGNPLGEEFAGSVTSGVISAVNRSIDTVNGKKINLIQTDAAINPGNSGGALVNSQGQVIGVNTAKVSSTGVEGIGFAIPINEVKPIMEQLIKYTYIKGRPQVGIGGVNVDERTAQYYGIPLGVYVKQVTPFSGAERAGIQVGDVITSFAGKTVKTIEEINDIKKSYKVGDVVKVVLSRDGETKTVSLKLTEER